MGKQLSEKIESDNNLGSKFLLKNHDPPATKYGRQNVRIKIQSQLKKKNQECS